MKTKLFYSAVIVAFVSSLVSVAHVKATENLLKKIHEEGCTKMRIFKQDPTVTTLGFREVVVPGKFKAGPSNPYLKVDSTQTRAPLSNSQGDLLFTQGTLEADAVHTTAVVWSTIVMYLQDIDRLSKHFPESKQISALAKKWAERKQKLYIFHHNTPDDENAFFTRFNDENDNGKEKLELRFFSFNGSNGRVDTCKSLDVVAHECGHFFLDTIHPDYLEATAPQAGAVHEAFGDLTAMFLALNQHDQCEALFTETKGDLHKPSFLSKMAEQFGTGIGSNSGLRNMDEDIDIKKAGQEVHDLSRVLTGAVYDVLVDGYNQASKERLHLTTGADLLYTVALELRQIFLHAIIENQDPSPKFPDVAHNMVKLAPNSSIKWGEYIKKQFTRRGVPVEANSTALNWINENAKCHKKGICGTVHKSFNSSSANS